MLKRNNVEISPIILRQQFGCGSKLADRMGFLKPELTESEFQLEM